MADLVCFPGSEATQYLRYDMLLRHVTMCAMALLFLAPMVQGDVCPSEMIRSSRLLCCPLHTRSIIYFERAVKLVVTPNSLSMEFIFPSTSPVHVGCDTMNITSEADCSYGCDDGSVRTWSCVALSCSRQSPSHGTEYFAPTCDVGLSIHGLTSPITFRRVAGHV